MTKAIDRRTVLTGLGALGSALLVGCSSPASKVEDGGGGCVVTPEGEIGPYFADDSAAGFARGNVLANLDGTNVQAGVPLLLNLFVYDAQKSCAPVSGAQLDLWHCNVAGVYSDVAAAGTADQNWLRGYQLTDAAGKASFTTIVPGWYPGRTTHIHLRVRSAYNETASTTDGANTTQLFFPQTLVDMLAADVALYQNEGANPTTNALDHVYSSETQGKTRLSPTGSASAGFVASFSLYLPI